MICCSKVTDYSTAVQAISFARAQTLHRGWSILPDRRFVPIIWYPQFAISHFHFRLQTLDFRLTGVLEKFIRQLAAADHLTDENVRAAVDQLVDERVAAELKADFLCHLALKGETVD